MRGFRAVCCAALLCSALEAGPRELGMAALDRAMEDRGRKSRPVRLGCELGDGPAESWRIEGARVTGGDLRGLMYGLFEAAAQVKANGWVAPARGTAAVAIRGVRLTWNPAEPGEMESWRGFVELLARSRINRLQLVVGEPERSVEFLRALSQLCASYAVDFVLGLTEQPADGPAVYGRLKQVFGSCPLVRTVRVRVAGEPETGFYRHWVLRAAEEAGRFVTVELPASSGAAGRQVRLARPWSEDVRSGAEEYLEVPSPLERGAPVWADPLWARHVTGITATSGARGFEIAAPWPWRGHEAFYRVWGRIGYNPSLPQKALAAELDETQLAALAPASRAFTLTSLLAPGRLTREDLDAAAAEAAAEARTALERVSPEDAARIRELLKLAPENPPASRPPMPKVQHFPPRSAPANIAFPLGLIVTPPAGARSVRLHYRENGGEFRAMEAPASRAWFQLKAASSITYYFEIVPASGRAWLYPDPLTGAPYLHLPVRVRIEPKQ